MSNENSSETRLVKCPHCHGFIKSNSVYCPKCNTFTGFVVKDSAESMQPAVPHMEPVIHSDPVVEPQPVEPVSKQSVQQEQKPAQQNQPVLNTIIKNKNQVCSTIDEAEEEMQQEPASEEDYEGAEAFNNMLKKSKHTDEDDEDQDSELKTAKLSSFAKTFVGNVKNNVSDMIPKQKVNSLKHSNGEYEEKYEDEEEFSQDEQYEEDVQDEQYEEEVEEDNFADEENEFESLKKNTTHSSFNANSDGAYDNVLAEIDARTEHITQDMIIKTISFIICIVLLVFFMINFI